MPIVLAAALLAAGGAVFLTANGNDPLACLLSRTLALRILAAILLWYVPAWGARRLLAGRGVDGRVESLAGFIWGRFMFGLLLAVAILVAGWLAALAFAPEAAARLARALVLVIVATALTGMSGGALLNSLLALRGWRARRQG